MSDFNAKIKASLDTSIVNSQLKTIGNSKIKFQNIEFDSSSLQSAFNQTLKNVKVNVTPNINVSNSGKDIGKNIANAINSQISTKTLVPAQSAIDNLAKSLTGKGLEKNAIAQIVDSITASAKQADIQITKVSDAFQSAGKNAGNLKQFRIEGIDSLGNAVKILDTFDAKTGKLNSSITTVTSTFNNASTAVKATTQNLESMLNTGISNGKFKADLDMVDLKFKELGTGSTQLSANLQQLKQSFDTMNDTNNSMDVRINAMQQYLGLLPGVRAQITELKAEETAAAQAAKQESDAIKQAAKATSDALKQAQKEATALQKADILSNDIQAWMNNNARAAEVFGDELRSLLTQLQNDKSPEAVARIGLEFRKIKSEANAARLTTDTFGESIKNAALQFFGLTSAVQVIRKVVTEVKKACETVIELDTALVDLQKTAKASASELQDFYYEANEIAKEYGATTKDIISSASEWSRLGFNLEDSKTMAKVSSLFQSISPGLSIEEATDGLVSAMKANLCLCA